MIHGRDLAQWYAFHAWPVLALCCVSFCFGFTLKVFGEFSGLHIVYLQVHIPSDTLAGLPHAPSLPPFCYLAYPHRSLNLTPWHKISRFLSKDRQGSPDQKTDISHPEGQCSALEGCRKLGDAGSGGSPFPEVLTIVRVWLWKDELSNYI